MSEKTQNVAFPKTEADRKSNYRLNFKKALTLTLAVFLILVNLLPRISVEVEEPGTPHIPISVEHIPATRQVHVPPPPPRPAVPVPTESEEAPADETIEEFDLKMSDLFAESSEGPRRPVDPHVVPPRPIAWVFPEYPEEMKKKGIRGVVKLSIQVDESGEVAEVIVLENSTGSEKCAEAAVAAAYGSRFYPATRDGKPVQYWITQPYRFDFNE